MAAYRIIKKLGQGGMGVVYLAVQTSLDRQIALKLLTEDCRTNQAYFARFLREVQASTRVSHKNIIKIIDYGEIEGQPFYAMEYLDAPTLEDKYKKDGNLSIALTIKVAEQLLSALSCMHRAGLVHRDLKPSNVMMDDAGHITLMDFGLVKDLERTQMTAQGKIVGTPGYLSPEVILGKDVDGRADLFSLGILLWEILCGDRPFGGDSLQSLLMGIVKGPHKPVREERKDCPEYLSKFIDKLLEKSPDARFPSAAAALKALRVAQGKPVPAEASDDSIDNILDFSGEVAIDGPVPQAAIEGGLDAIAGLSTPAAAPSGTASSTLPPSGVEPPSGIANPGSNPRKTRTTRPTPRITRTQPITVAPAKSGPPVALIGGVVALVVAGGLFLALRPRAEPKPAPSPSVEASASATPDAAPAAPKSLVDLGRALEGALDSLKPLDVIGHMHEDLLQAEKQKKRWYEHPPLKVLEVRQKWEEKLARLCGDLKLASAMATFSVRKENYYTDPTVPPGDRLRLYLKLHDFQDLANWCRRCGVPLPVDPASGFYEGYGQLGRSQMPDAPAVVVSFAGVEHTKPEHLEKLALPANHVAIRVPEGERYYIRGDSRVDDLGGALVEMGKERLFYKHPRPLPLPPLDQIEALEICGWASDLAANNRFVISIREDDRGWRDVGVIRGADTTLRPIAHTLERSLLTGKQLSIGIRFVLTPDMIAWSEYGNFPRLGIRYRAKRP